jgi:hypothetical protein
MMQSTFNHVALTRPQRGFPTSLKFSVTRTCAALDVRPSLAPSSFPSPRPFSTSSRPPVGADGILRGLREQTSRRPPNRESLRLYRDILRTSRRFTLPHESGRSWGDILAESARTEFEAARDVTDGEEIARLLVVGTDALMRVQEQLRVAEQRLAATAEAAARGQGGLGAGSSSSSAGPSRAPPRRMDAEDAADAERRRRRAAESAPRTIVEVDESPYTLDQRAPGEGEGEGEGKR